MSETKNQTSFEIKQVISQPYKYGFETKIEKETFPCGINEEIVKLISSKKGEPEFLQKFRLKAYKKWTQMKLPEWANLTIKPIDYDAITYYSIPKQKKKLDSLEEVDPEILKTFEKLGISLDEQKITPDFASFSLYVVATETLSKTASTATFESFFCSSKDIPSFSKVFKISGSTSSNESSFFFCFGIE